MFVKGPWIVPGPIDVPTPRLDWFGSGPVSYPLHLLLRFGTRFPKLRQHQYPGSPPFRQ